MENKNEDILKAIDFIKNNNSIQLNYNYLKILLSIYYNYGQFDTLKNNIKTQTK